MTIEGGPAGEAIDGTDAADVIAGGGGADKIRGLAGNDILCGGPGDDVLKGGDGNDKMLGGSGPDACNGGPGNDSAKSCATTRSLSELYQPRHWAPGTERCATALAVASDVASSLGLGPPSRRLYGSSIA